MEPANTSPGSTSKETDASAPTDTWSAYRFGTPDMILIVSVWTTLATTVPGDTMVPTSTRRSFRVPRTGARIVVRSRRACSASRFPRLCSAEARASW